MTLLPADVDYTDNDRYVALVDWERNGYDDSDFYEMVLDRKEKKIFEHMTHSTRFAGGSRLVASNKPTKEDVILARSILADWLHNHYYNQAMNAYCHLANVKVGDILCLKESHRNQPLTSKECVKCQGKGFWQNPSRETDKRPCFGCRGVGRQIEKVSKNMITHPAGTIGTVIAFDSFKDAYGRSQGTTVVMLMKDGANVFRAPPDKLTWTDKPIPHKNDFKEGAILAANEDHYEVMATVSCAWLSNNYAKKAMAEK